MTTQAVSKEVSTSQLIKSLKSPDYDVIGDSDSLKKKSRREIKSIQTALRPPDVKHPDFEIEATEFGFRPKYSDNPLKKFKPVLTTGSLTTSSSESVCMGLVCMLNYGVCMRTYVSKV